LKKAKNFIYLMVSKFSSMAEELSFQSSLLYMYWLMSGADGVKNFDSEDPEWRMMRAMRKHENISAEDFNTFVNTDFGNQDTQLKIALDVIRKSGYDDRTRVLAWVYKIMAADGVFHTKERELYDMVLRELAVDESDVVHMAKALPSI
jgi:uncharacterized tellurite resistance protein B-like protein